MGLRLCTCLTGPEGLWWCQRDVLQGIDFYCVRCQLYACVCVFEHFVCSLCAYCRTWHRIWVFLASPGPYSFLPSGAPFNLCVTFRFFRRRYRVNTRQWNFGSFLVAFFLCKSVRSLWCMLLARVLISVLMWSTDVKILDDTTIVPPAPWWSELTPKALPTSLNSTTLNPALSPAHQVLFCRFLMLKVEQSMFSAALVVYTLVVYTHECSLVVRVCCASSTMQETKTTMSASHLCITGQDGGLCARICNRWARSLFVKFQWSRLLLSLSLYRLSSCISKENFCAIGIV